MVGLDGRKYLVGDVTRLCQHEDGDEWQTVLSQISENGCNHFHLLQTFCSKTRLFSGLGKLKTPPKRGVGWGCS